MRVRLVTHVPGPILVWSGDERGDEVQSEVEGGGWRGASSPFFLLRFTVMYLPSSLIRRGWQKTPRLNSVQRPRCSVFSPTVPHMGLRSAASNCSCGCLADPAKIPAVGPLQASDSRNDFSGDYWAK